MQLDSWTRSLVDAMGMLWQKFTHFIPSLIGALVIVLLGFLAARLLDALVSRLLARLGLDRLMQGTGLTRLLSRAGVQVPLSAVIGKVLYWFVLLVFVVTALESLGLERISAALDMLALYVPKVLAAAVVLLSGVLLAQLLNTLVSGAAEGVGLEYAAGLGRLTQGLVIVISISVAIGQLDVKAELLNYVVAIVLASMGLAVALAIGLGSRALVGQILAGIYVRELYPSGQHVQLDQLEGTVELVGTVKTLIRTTEGVDLYVPNSVLLEQTVRSRRS